jgi:hypothetical protein
MAKPTLTLEEAEATVEKVIMNHHCSLTTRNKRELVSKLQGGLTAVATVPARTSKGTFQKDDPKTAKREDRAPAKKVAKKAAKDKKE